MAENYVLLMKPNGGVVRKLAATNKKRINAFKEEGYVIITDSALKTKMNKGAKEGRITAGKVVKKVVAKPTE